MKKLPLIVASCYFVISTLAVYAATFTHHDGGLWIVVGYLPWPIGVWFNRFINAVVPQEILYEWHIGKVPLQFVSASFACIVLGTVWWYMLSKLVCRCLRNR